MSHQLHHVGHVVKNIEDGIKLYEEKLGLTPAKFRGPKKGGKFGSSMVFYPFANIYIELIEPGGLGGDPAARCLKERGEGIFHISILVDDYDSEIKALREKGFTVEEFGGSDEEDNAEMPAVKMAFLAPEETNGLWIEYMQAPHPPLD